MRFSSAFFAATVVLPIFAAPTFKLVPIIKRGGTLKEDSYIITLNDGASRETVLESLRKGFTQPDSAVIYTYSVINGFSATIKPSDITFVRGMPEIASIEQDRIISLPDHEVVDGLPPIGGGQSTPPANENAHNDNDGEGVVIYGVDTGIHVEHECFEGRASWGWVAPLLLKVDGHGHGTHTAGTAVCKGFGVATKAKIVAVKVMNEIGTGQTTDIIAGLDYIYKKYEKEEGRTPTVVTMSIGGDADGNLDSAVQKCIDKGMHFTVAAGNDNKDAAGYSPARAEEANTVGAVDSKNAKADFSNWGRVVDIQAPGVNIVSAGNLGKNSQKTMSGTSMATPYVAGILAVALSNHGQMTPAALSQKLVENSKPVCTGMPDGTTNALATRW